MKEVKLNSKDFIDLQNLTDTRLLVQANSGGGKSWLLRRILEQSHGKIQHIVIDLEGEFSTLREKYDYILAGKDGDTPADPRSAALLARKVLELNVSAIIDLYELNHYDRKRFVKLFLEALVNAPKELWHPCLVVIDEAHVFCPEKGQSEASDAVIDLATRGRKRGFCALLATQRISKLHKDAAAECNNKLIGRTGLDIDMKRASEELGFSSKEQMLSLRNLDAGEFFAFGPAISKSVSKIKVGDVKTTHPKAGSRILTKKPTPPTDKIKKVLGKLADLPEEAKKELNTLAEYKNEVSTLRRELTLAKKDGGGIDEKKVKAMIGDAVWKHGKEWEKIVKEWQSFAEGLIWKLKVIIEKQPPKLGVPVGTLAPSNLERLNVGVDIGGPNGDKTVRAFFKQDNDGRIKVVDIQTDEDFRPSKSQQAILNSLVLALSIGLEDLDKSQLALLADQSPKSGGYFNNLGTLRTRGLIDYPTGGRVCITEEGKALGEATNIPTTTEELQEQLFKRLSSSQVAILKVLISNYPHSVPKSELAELAGQEMGRPMSATSGGYFNNLGRLRSLKLIDYPQPASVAAEKILFLE